MTQISLSTAPSRRSRNFVGFEKLGAVLALIVLFALAVEPFATFRPNRIASGQGLGMTAALPWMAALIGFGVLGFSAALAVIRIAPLYRFALAATALGVLAWLIGLVPAALVPPDNTFARIAPAAGFWLLVFAFAILLTDAATKLRFGPFARLALLIVAILGLGLVLGSGHWDGLSIMREYRTNADKFWLEGLKHVQLAFGSLTAAVIVGLPLGIACHRHARLRGVMLPILNIIQTVPSMAMYGLMLVPLGLLAAHSQIAAALGIRGIGTAPALIALFLYSLLPVVANTVVGLAEVSRSAVDAARGMGMTSRQRLFQVELPLALPVILTGVRVVLVQNIGLVTIAALIGGGGFGTFVFQGIGQQASDLVLLGAVPTIALAFTAAILLDAVIEISKGRGKRASDDRP